MVYGARLAGCFMGLEGFDVGESRTRSTSGPGFDSQQIHWRINMSYKKNDRVLIIGGPFKHIVGTIDSKIPFTKQYNVKIPPNRIVPVAEKHLTGA